MKVGETFQEDGNLWTCVAILEAGDRFDDFGFETNNNGVRTSPNTVICVCWTVGGHGFYIDRFYYDGIKYVNSSGGVTFESTPIIIPPPLPERIAQVLGKQPPKSKRFASVFYAGWNCRLVVCIDTDTNSIVRYDNEIVSPYWPLNVEIKDRVDLDITFEQYLAINNFQKVSIPEIRQQIVDKLGCQKENLTPVLDAFIELLKITKKSTNNSYLGHAKQVLSDTFFHSEELSKNFNNLQKEMSALLKDIQKAI